MGVFAWLDELLCVSQRFTQSSQKCYRTPRTTELGFDNGVTRGR